MTRQLSLTALILALGLAAVAWLAAAPTPFLIPFQAVKSFRALSQTNRSVSLFMRKPEGTYVELAFSIASPYKMLTSLAALGSLIANPGAFVSTPAGPANVGRAGQVGVGGVFTTTGGLGGAYFFPGLRRVGVYLGTASLLYTGDTVYNLPNSVDAMVAEDLNGDHALDLVFAMENASPVTNTGAPGGVGVMMNKGDGTFAPLVKYPSSADARSVAALDLNKDGRVDIVVTDTTTSSLWVLLGNGNGTFGAAVPYPTLNSNNFSVTIADFTGEGIPDLAAVGSGGLVILPGNGDGTFRAGSQLPSTNPGAAFYIVAGDFNGDGKLDLATPNAYTESITVYMNTGGGQFQAGESYAASYDPESLIVADVNHDGKLDIVNGIGDARWFGPSLGSYTVDILYGNGDGTFQAAPIYGFDAISVLAVADFNGDGRNDVVSGDQYVNQLNYYVGQPGGRFAQPQTISLGSANQVLPGGAVVGDFNGDQKPDVAVTEGTQSGQVAILLNTGSGFQPPSTISSGGQVPSAIAAADFDGDGQLDLAVTNSGSGTTAILKGGGNGSFQLLASYPTGSQPYSISARDFNGDGRIDLAVGDNASGGKMYLLRNNGAGAFTVLTPVALGTQVMSVTLKDVNADNRPDAIAAVTSGQFTWSIAVALGNGDGTFQTPTLLATDFGPSDALVEDFDGDGIQDIVAVHCCGDTYPGYYRGTGGGAFIPEQLLDIPTSPAVMRAVRNPSDPNSLPDLILGRNPGGLMTLPNIQRNFRNRNSASFVPGQLAPDMIATSEVLGIAPSLLVSTQTPWTTDFGGVHVDVIDNTGTSRPAPIYYVAPTAASYLIPAGTAFGFATVNLRSSTGKVSSEDIYINPAAPGIYSANSSGSGAAAAFYLRVAGNGARTQDLVFDPSTRLPVPLDLGPTADQVYLLLYGTGFRNATSVAATVGTASVPVLGTAPHSIYQGLDQVNIGPLPRTLIGAGVVNVQLTFDGQIANAVTVQIK